MNEIGIRMINQELWMTVVTSRMPTVLNEVSKLKFMPKLFSSFNVRKQIGKYIKIVSQWLPRIEGIFLENLFNKINEISW